MLSATYQDRRGELLEYFDRTAAETWSRLTSDAPVSRIRSTVRAGREAMRQTLLDYLPADLSGRRILDAGCGTGALAVAAAERGAEVVAIDLSERLVAIARERAPTHLRRALHFEVGDMLDPRLGEFAHVVAMDSVIHYRAGDARRIVAALAARATESVLFTFAPRTHLLAAMHLLGRLFPRGERAPAIEPVSEHAIRRALASEPDLALWQLARSERVGRGFYISQAMELVRLCAG